MPTTGIPVTYVPNSTGADGLPSNQPVSITSDISILDAVTGAKITIDEEHSQLHNGKHFRCEFVSLSLANAGTYNFLIVAPSIASNKMAHTVVSVDYQGETQVNVFENPSASNLGSLKTTYNNNRNSSILPFTTIYDSPTVTSNGTQLAAHHEGAGKNIGAAPREEDEVILKQGGTYLYSVQNASGGNEWVDVEVSWYEL